MPWKNYLLIDTLREIKKTKGRFLSLIFLTILGVGFFVGFRASVPLMDLWLDDFLITHHVSTHSIQSVFGLSEEDLEKISALDDRLELQGAYQSHTLVNGSVLELRSISSGSLNQLILMEGKFPEKETECVIAVNYGKNIGDTLVIEDKTVTIVGKVQSPLHLDGDFGSSTLGSGVVNGLIYLPESFFSGDFQEIYFHTSSIPTEQVEELLLDIQVLGDTLWAEKSVQYLQISKDRVALLALELEEEQAQQEADALYWQEAVILSREAVSEAWKQLEEDKAWLSQSGEEERRLEINALEETYNQNLLLEQNQAKEGEILLASMEKALGQAQRDDHLLNYGSWSLERLQDNPSMKEYRLDALQLSQLATAFPLIFFSITALVSWAIMGQMVEEQRNTIGTLRSFGYSILQIIGKYVSYGLLIWVFGSCIGLFLGLYLLPHLIYNIWSETYAMGVFQWQWFPSLSLSAVLVAFLTLSISAVIPCFSTVFSYPATLLQDKAPKGGGKIFLEYSALLWHDLTFHQKITLRNVFRDPKRFFSNVFAIAAVTGVAVSAFSMRTARSEAMYRQYQELYRHTTQIFLRDDVTLGERLNVHGVLATRGLSQSFTSFSSQSITAKQPNSDLSQETKLYTVQNDLELDKVFYIRQNKWKPYYMPDTGAVVPLKLAEELGLTLGDYITLEGDFGTVDAKITALSEFYTEQTILMTHFYYEWLTDQAVEINEIWVDYSDMKDWSRYSSELDKDLLALEGTTGISHRADERSSYTQGIQTTDYTILFMISASTLLVYVVLSYLNSHNLSRRKGELATLKVLGMTDYELSAYIYKENIILTFYGLACGMVVGQNFHHWLIRSMELPDVMLFRGVYIFSYINGAGLVMFLAILVNVQMYFTLQTLNVTSELRGTRE